MCVWDLTHASELACHFLIPALAVIAGSSMESRRVTAKTLVSPLQVYGLTREQTVFKTGYQYFELLHLREGKRLFRCTWASLDLVMCFLLVSKQWSLLYIRLFRQFAGFEACHFGLLVDSDQAAILGSCCCPQGDLLPVFNL